MILSKCAKEEYAQEQIIREACKAGSVMAKTFIFAWHLSHPRRSRFGRKRLRPPSSKASLRPADAMIRVFSLEQCQLWKPWPRWCFAIMHCGREPLACRWNREALKQHELHRHHRLRSTRPAQDALEDVL